MLTYIGRRFLQMIPVFIGVTILLFILRTPGVLPGDPVKLITGERAISPALYNQIVKENALDRSIPYQYVRWMSHLFHGDLGESYQLKRPVSSVLWDKFPNTFKLALVAILIEAVLDTLRGQAIFVLGHAGDAQYVHPGSVARLLAGHAAPGAVWH